LIPMLAVDVAWSDEPHVRVIGPRTGRRKGEALYALHACAVSDESVSIPPARPPGYGWQGRRGGRVLLPAR
jgi:hypothetical protein